VADAARCPQSTVPLDHFAHQLIGVQASFHQRLGLARADELDGPCCRFVAVLGFLYRQPGEVETALLRDRLDARPRSDEDGCDEAHLRRTDGALE